MTIIQFVPKPVKPTGLSPEDQAFEDKANEDFANLISLTNCTSVVALDKILALCARTTSYSYSALTGRDLAIRMKNARKEVYLVLNPPIETNDKIEQWKTTPIAFPFWPGYHY